MMFSIAVNQHTTLILRDDRPYMVENDGVGFDPIDDAARYVGHPLEASDPEIDNSGAYTYRVWFHEECDCGCQA